MFDLIKQVIESKAYKLEDMLYKINKMYVEDFITEQEKEELDDLARTNANPINSYAPLQEQINKICKEFVELRNTVEANAIGMLALKNSLEKLGGKIETTETKPKEEYKEFMQPSGAHDAYNIGDKIIYKGKKYICKIDGCVWSPDAYPSAWEEVA